MAVIRGESCFEKNAFKDTENPHPPTKTRLQVKGYLGKYSRYRKKNCSVLKLFLRPILFHGKLSFDNLNYFKLYGNLNPVLALIGALSNQAQVVINFTRVAINSNLKNTIKKLYLVNIGTERIAFGDDNPLTFKTKNLV